MTQTLPRTDRQLTAAIIDEQALTPNLTADRIGVSLTDGAVTLSGRVRTYPEKEAAVRATMRVLGGHRDRRRDHHLARWHANKGYCYLMSQERHLRRKTHPSGLW